MRNISNLGGKAGSRLRLAWQLTCLAGLSSCNDVTVVVGAFDDGRPVHLDAGPSPMIGSQSPMPGLDAGKPDGSLGIETRDGASGPAGQPSSDPGMPQAAAKQELETGSWEAYCRRSGPAIHRVAPSGSEPSCVAGIGRRYFSYGLCSCRNLELMDDGFLHDAFDSTEGIYVAGRSGGAIGVNGSLLQMASTTLIYGSVVVAGDVVPAIDVKTFWVGADFKTNAALNVVAGDINFKRDVWVGGDISANVPVMVGRDVYRRPNQSLSPQVVIGGTSYARDVIVKAPCPCGAEQIDIARIVKQAHASNDNQAVAFSPDTLSGTTSPATEMYLSCGRFALGPVNMSGITAINAYLRTALFVDGDMTITGNVVFNPGLVGELDLFVSGDLNLTNLDAGVFGNPSRPAALRIFVGGSGTIKLSDQTAFAAQLYAPNAALELSTEALGSIVANDIRVAGTHGVHLDRAALRLGEQPCAAPASIHCADACGDCSGGLACIAGTCAPCRGDEDCCSPFVCSSGVCQPLLSD